MSDHSQKTEQPTQRRLLKARQDGNFPAARHMVSASQFLLFVALLGSGGAHWFGNLRQSTSEIFGKAFAADVSAAQLAYLFTGYAWKAFLPLLSLGALLVLGTLSMQLAVTRFGVSLKKVWPDLKRLSPLSKLRELPKQNIPAFIQA